MSLKPYFQLIRLPNLFTAAADSLAGWLLVRGTLDQPGKWLPLCAASMAIYAAGIALNDLFDYEIDRKERPNRPLPSGRVSRKFAAGFGVAGLVAGLILAACVSVPSLIVAAALIACVLLYDGGIKRTVLGPEIMGACRGLNLLLGLSVAADFGGPSAWLAAGSLAVFVIGLTWISRSEVETGQSRGVTAGMIVQNVALVGLFVVAFRARTFPGTGGERPIVPVEGLLVLAVVALIVNSAVGRAVVDPSPKTIQTAVKTGVLSLVWLDVGLVAAVRGPGPALAVAALWVPAFVLGKWLYST
ncbi:MAG: 4-hydroxybenzoate polyprenyltransferase-like prenyltransferase [Planctomycetota bacterium]|nr:4-hydroxybenzoate polyprenyltransferase-like prenyltransferase [Planctomycetota bacterium]